MRDERRPWKGRKRKREKRMGRPTEVPAMARLWSLGQFCCASVSRDNTHLVYPWSNSPHWKLLW